MNWIVKPYETQDFEHFKQWNDEAERGLSEAVGSDLELIRREVNEGRSSLYRVGGDTWVVVYTEMKNLIVCCVQGKRADKVLDVLSRLAQSRGLEDIRFFTKRSELIKLSKGFGFNQEYVVMRASIKDVRNKFEGKSHAHFSKALQQIPEAGQDVGDRHEIKPHVCAS